MELKQSKLEISGQIAIITIDREKAMNALNAELMDDFHHLFNIHLPSQDIIGVVLTGAGSKAFAAGADIKEFIGLTEETGAALSAKGHEIFNSIENFPKPVIAAINGFSLGGGNELAMACHMRIASSNARFGQPEVNLGLLPGYGGTQRLPKYVGKAKAMELILTGRMIDATEAHRIGLVNNVVEEGKAVEAAVELINRIGTKGPTAISKSIEAINNYDKMHIDGYDAEVKMFGDCLASTESTEGINAFLEKRKANFTDNK